MLQYLESGDLGIAQFNVGEFVGEGGRDGLEDEPFEKGFDRHIGAELEEVAGVGATGFGKFLGGMGVITGFHAWWIGRIGSGVGWRCLGMGGDGQISRIGGDEVEMAVTATAASARDGESVGIYLLAEENKGGIVGAIIGGGDLGEFLMGKLGEEIGHVEEQSGEATEEIAECCWCCFVVARRTGAKGREDVVAGR
jgi:hypothetical protein